MQAGGEFDAAVLGRDCMGWIDATRADVALTYRAGNFPLFISAESRADTTLVVRAPDGSWLCNDDFRASTPGSSSPVPLPASIASGSAPSTKGGRNQRCCASRGAASGPGGRPTAGPDVSAPARYATLSLEAGFMPDPREIRVDAGGELDAAAANLGRDCVGWIDASRADVTLTYRAGNFPLVFLVDSRADTTLVIRTPNGQWLCNDDFQGLNPGVVIERPASGEYRIWVGTFDRGRPQPAVLRITEILPRR